MENRLYRNIPKIVENILNQVNTTHGVTLGRKDLKHKNTCKKSVTNSLDQYFTWAQAALFLEIARLTIELDNRKHRTTVSQPNQVIRGVNLI